LDVEGAVDDFMRGIKSHLHFAGIGINDEGLMLGERGWSEQN
jgi:hypothetical protein